jgi:hypothetical protein
VEGIYEKKMIRCIQLEMISIFWYVTPCIPTKVKRRFGGKYGLHLSWPIHQFRRSKRKKFSETSDDFHCTTLPYIPGDKIIESYRCVNLRSKNITGLQRNYYIYTPDFEDLIWIRMASGSVMFTFTAKFFKR